MSTSPRSRSPLAGEDGDILLGWLTKLVIGFAVVGVAAFDAIAISSTHVGLSDDGTYAASAAATSWHDIGDPQIAYDAAVAAAAEKNPQNRIDPKAFGVDPDGRVSLTIARTAKTVVVHRIGPTASWAEVHENASGGAGG